MLTYKQIQTALASIDRPGIMVSSAVFKDRLANIVSPRKHDISVAVEIGTYRGLSAAVLASLGIKVHTFDVVFQDDALSMWDRFGCFEMVDYRVPPFCQVPEFRNLSRENLIKVIGDEHLVKSGRDWIRTIIEMLDFQFAFIDAQHTYEDVSADFEMVSRCGLVLLHDNRDSFPGVKRFCKEIGAKPIGEFALWQE